MILIIARAVLLLLFLLSIYLPLRASLRWEGRWRYAALMPLAFPLTLLGFVFVRLTGEEPSYALSAYLFLGVTFAGLACMGIVYLLYRRFGG